MATRSTITGLVAGGKYTTVYCHWDGYPEHNGKILDEHYSTQEAVDQLLSNGPLSILAPDPGCPDGHSFDEPVKGFCVYYGRDRDEQSPGFIGHGDTVAEAQQRTACGLQEYNYVWDGVTWTVDGENLKEVLARLLTADEEDEALPL